MIKSIGIRQGDAWTPHHGDYTGWRGSLPVMVYHRTKRSITRARNHELELIAAGPANWQRGTIHLK